MHDPPMMSMSEIHVRTQPVWLLSGSGNVLLMVHFVELGKHGNVG